MTLSWKSLSIDETTLQIAFAPNGDLYAVLAVAGQTPPRYAFLAISDEDFHGVKGFKSIAIARRAAEKYAQKKGILK